MLERKADLGEGESHGVQLSVAIIIIEYCTASSSVRKSDLPRARL